MELHEAQLFRCLTSFFGAERVVHRVSVKAACGGELPPEYSQLSLWAVEYKCLFTIVDNEGEPKLVVEFSPIEDHIIDARLVENLKFLEPMLKKRGVQYVALKLTEFSESLDPEASIDFCGLLNRKLGIEPSSTI